MPIELPTDTPAPLVPLFWLVGRWAGVGVVGYPTMAQDLRFSQEITFEHDGRPFLSYTSRTWLLDEEGTEVRRAATETGFWRPVGEPAAGPEPGAAGETGTALEVLLAHPTGIIETYHGSVSGARIELATDVVARTETAKAYNAGRRMYGLVEGDLLWAMDMAAMGVSLSPHASARLKRLPPAA